MTRYTVRIPMKIDKNATAIVQGAAGTVRALLTQHRPNLGLDSGGPSGRGPASGLPDVVSPLLTHTAGPRKSFR